MKLTKKIMLFEDFSASTSDKQNAQASAPTTANSVAVDATAQDVTGETLRTEIVKDVDSILTRLSELSDNIKEGLNIHEAFNQYEILLEELVEEDEELNEKIIDIIKSPIKYTKIKNNLKKYQKALVQISINDVDFAKKMQASDADSGKGTERRATLDAANTAKNKALKDQADAISARMTELAISDGLKLIVSSGKNKAKLQAAKIVMKATSGEEAKQLKLKIETLEDRIADDGKSLKDYAKKNPASAETSNDDEGGNSSQSAQDAMDANAKKAKEDGKKEAGKTEDGKKEDGKKEAGKTEDGKKEDGKKEDGKKEDGKKEDGKKEDGKKEDGGKKFDEEKGQKAIDDAQGKLDGLDKETTSPQDMAKAEVELLKAKIAMAKGKGEDTDGLTSDLEKAVDKSKMKSKATPTSNTGGQQKNDNQSLEIDSDLTVIEESSVSGLQVYDAEGDDYKWFTTKFAKENKVKVTIDRDTEWSDEMSVSGKKEDILKFVKLTGHADLFQGKNPVYTIDESLEAEDVNEGLHPKLKKAQKAIDKGETVYGENVRFPGRFKIIKLGDLFATVDYEDGTEPMEMASMNVKIDSLQFESVETEEVNKPKIYENMSVAQRFKSLMS